MSLTKLLAWIVSVIFHPLLLFTYVLVLMLLVNPYDFGVHQLADRKILLIKVFMGTFMLPLIGTVLMERLGLIKSVLMNERMDRIVPYIMIIIFYLMITYFIYKNPFVSGAYKSFVLGGLIALFIAFFINNFSKISVHTVGMGGVVAVLLILILVFKQRHFTVPGLFSTSLINVFLFSLLAAGAVGSARLYLKAHEPKDLWGGYLVGFAAQFIALKILL